MVTPEEIATELGATPQTLTIARLPNGAGGANLDELRKEVERNMANPRYVARGPHASPPSSRDEYLALRRAGAKDATSWAD